MTWNAAMSNKDDEKLADNLLRGAGPIAEELLGDKKKRRTIYAMSEQEKQDLGLFYMGKLLCGLKSKMRERIAARAAGQSAA